MPTYHLTQGVARIAGGASDSKPFVLESGATLPVVDVRYSVYGEPNEAQDNIVLVCHALSGSSRIDQWWPLLLDEVFDLIKRLVDLLRLIDREALGHDRDARRCGRARRL